MIHLYVKRHTKTGLKYFGKTSRKDPRTYNGSGKYWLRHIKLHGIEYVETVQVWTFTDQDECSAFALKYSKENDIVKSESWANLKPENGLDGGTFPTGVPLSNDHKANISKSLKGRQVSEETRTKISQRLKGRARSEEHCEKISQSHLGKKMPPRTEEQRRAIAVRRTGQKHSPNTLSKLKEAKKGELNPFYGKKHSEETKLRMSEAAKAARARRSNK